MLPPPQASDTASSINPLNKHNNTFRRSDMHDPFNSSMIEEPIVVQS
jgi:hypothetical protein